MPEPRRAAPGTELRTFQDAMPRCADGSTPVLSGDGTERAMLIGQAPGWREIATGVPFAHDAGKRLAGWLALAGISLDDFRSRWYVTSVSKCYPGRRPGASVDSPPSRADLAIWAPILEQEVRLLGPRLVLLVGGLAHRFAFGPQARLDDLVGKPLTWELAPGASVLALPHPSGASTWLNDSGRVALWQRSIELLRARLVGGGDAVNRETRIGIGLVALLGAVTFGLLLIGSIGEPREELQRLTVAQVLAQDSPADLYGDHELRIVGWYASLDADCVEPPGPPASTVPWLEQHCPLRVLMPAQPSEDVTQAELEEHGLRLAAPNGQPFPSRSEPTGPNLRLEQLVYVGHFDDEAAADCPADLREFCRNTFVVSDYDGLVR